MATDVSLNGYNVTDIIYIDYGNMAGNAVVWLHYGIGDNIGREPLSMAIIHRFGTSLR